MSEVSICQARASVMVYNNDIKKWEHAGGSQGISRVHVYHNTGNNNYRIVGRKVNDNEVVINCAIVKNLKYNRATPTFHQWRDQRQVYGLNFQSSEDAQSFSDTVSMAIKYMNLPPESQYAVAQTTGTSEDAPSPVPAQQNGTVEQNYQQFTHDPFHGRTAHVDTTRRSSHTEQQAPARPHQEPQAAPTPPQPPSQPPPAPAAPAPPPTPPVNTPPAGPPAPPSGPPPSSGGPPPPPGAPPPPSAGPPAPPPPPAPGGGGPPPPPPPPAAGTSSGGAAAGGGSLMDAIAGAKLKKRTPSDNPPKAAPAPAGGGGGGMDMMAEMQRKLKNRKMKSTSEEPAANKKPTEPIPAASSPSLLKKSNNFETNKKSIATPNENKARTIGGYSKITKQESNNEEGLSADQFKTLKADILDAVRKEINAAKEEIISTFKQEISRLADNS